MFPHPHDALPLPPRPHLNQYKKLAKDLLKAAQSPDPTTLHTWTAAWIASLHCLNTIAPHSPVILSEVEAQRSSASTQSKDPFPLVSSKTPKRNSLNESMPNHQTAPLENFAREKLSESPTLTTAQFILARAHGFESWPKLAQHIEATTRANSEVTHFEPAADAIIAGDKTK